MKKLFLGLVLLVMTAPSLAATCKISEYAFLVLDDKNKVVPVAREPAVATQTVTYTTAVDSAAMNAATRFVRVVCDAKAHFVFSVAGTNPTASSPYLPGDTPEYFGVKVGDAIIISFYDGSS